MALSTFHTLLHDFALFDILKDATVGFVCVQTVCCLLRAGLAGHRLGYTYFGQVCKGLVVLGAAEHIRQSFGTLCHKDLAC